MIVVHTFSGSIYEFDSEKLLVRRLGGNQGPTPRQGNDGEWKSYERVWLQISGHLIVVWGYDEKTNITKTTMLSQLTKVVFDEDVDSDKRVGINEDALRQLLGYKENGTVQDASSAP